MRAGPLLIAATALAAGAAPAVEIVTFREAVAGPRGETVAGPTRTATGRALRRDSLGGMVLETDAGELHVITSRDVVRAERDDASFEPLDPEAMGARLLKDLPASFRVHTTDHYVVAYDTSREYAEWASSLLEGLQKALVRYWRRQGLELAEPRFPLPIVIHASARDYQAAARAEGVGGGAVGYYSQKTNRVRMFDLTGSDELRAAGAGRRRGSRREIQRMLAMPAAEPLVATIVHEATHQVAFNTGVMQRYADLPLWLVEGMAVYFEAPEAGSSRGWRGIGKVNRRRLATFRRHLPEWNNATLRNLVASDKRFRDPRSGGVAYADAWALNYFLVKRRPDAYVGYVKELALRAPLEPAYPGETDEESARVAEFVRHFGDLDTLQREMLTVISRL